MFLVWIPNSFPNEFQKFLTPICSIYGIFKYISIHFGDLLEKMVVNISYMEHMGYEFLYIIYYILYIIFYILIHYILCLIFPVFVADLHNVWNSPVTVHSGAKRSGDASSWETERQAESHRTRNQFETWKTDGISKDFVKLQFHEFSGKLPLN